MACHVIRLLSDTECGACAGELPAGHAVITDEIEHPVFVAVCEGCTSGLPGVDRAIRILRRRNRSQHRCWRPVSEW